METLEIKKENKFFSRLISRETSVLDSSRRVYYGGASAAVPFLWETRPGTPKNALSDAALLPPLTPPPSYFSHCPSRSSNGDSTHQKSKPKLLYAIFAGLGRSRRDQLHHNLSSSSSYSSSSSSSCSSCSFSSPSEASKIRRRNSRGRRRSYGSGQYDGFGLPVSTLCFRGTDGKYKTASSSKKNGSRVGCYYSVGNVKKALLSVVGKVTV